MSQKRLAELYNKLKEYSDFDINENNTFNFLDTVSDIVDENNPESIPYILQYFDDKNIYSWVFESVCGALEYYSDLEYTIGIIKNLHIMFPRAEKWVERIFCTIFSTKNCYNILKQNIHLADKIYLNKILETLNHDTDFKQQVNELKALMIS